uniref:Uncharacterized protein n=1 Tax=Sinocyclocheilus anshuiensis TaxID=1608454 RepID=A0A671LAA5_9TELE
PPCSGPGASAPPSPMVKTALLTVVYCPYNSVQCDGLFLFFSQVHVGENDCAHVKVSQILPCYGEKVNLLDFQFPKKREDEIEPF